MTGKLFFDTECTDRWDFRSAWDADHQPHLVQLAYILDDSEGNIVEENSMIVRLPDGVESSPGAAKVHGITQQRINEEGVPRGWALDKFARACKQASLLVAHNFDFDSRVMAAAYHREGRAFNHGLPYYCTMQAATQVCRIPGKYGKDYKFASLDESYRTLVDVEGFSGAHDADADVRACRAVYYELLRRNL